MTPYEEMTAALKSATKRSQDRKSAAESLVAELFNKFVEYIQSPAQSLFLLPWNEQKAGYDNYSKDRMVGLPHSLRLDEKQDFWQFGLFIRLNPPNHYPVEGVSVLPRFRESGDGYKVIVRDGDSLFVQKGSPETFVPVFEAWVGMAKAIFESVSPTEKAESQDEGMGPQVWS